MPRPVVRLRRLTPEQEQRLTALRHASRLLDSAILIPGTQWRIGLDPIMGLIPGLGDLVSPLFTIALLWQSRDLGVPKLIQLRMLFNVAIDTVLGLFPVIGDLFDFAWKANDMNMALLERHAREERRPTAGDWAFVVSLIALLVALAVTPFLLAGWLLGLLSGWWR